MKASTIGSAIIGLVLGLLLNSGHAAAEEQDSSQSSHERVTKTCNRPKTEVSFRHEEDYEDACMALTNVEDFFHLYGHHVETPVKVEFRQNVTEMTEEGELVRVHSRFVDKGRKVLVTSIKSDFLTDPDRTDFGINFSKQHAEIRRDFQISRITHEISRFYVQDNLNEYGVESLPSVLKKFVAYVVQLTTIGNTDLKNKIRNNYSEASLSAVEDVSQNLYENDPQKFGVMSFKLFNGQDGNKLLTKILKGKVQLNSGDNK